ncbi:MAG: UDP-3-O-(3-hydroxymyristoyl)glucosamine N-acyltransferase [bacterium]
MITVNELAVRIGGEVEGDGAREVHGICALSEIQESCVTYLEKQRDEGMLEGAKPAAVICSRAVAIKGQTLIRAANPKLAFALALEMLYPPRKYAAGAHPSAVIESGAVVDSTASIGPNCYVGEGAHIGANAVLCANVVVVAGAAIGADCVLKPNVTVLESCELGERVILHSGVVIGADGFGYVQDQGINRKVPQVGRVVIEDDVEIGANSAVDRATLGATRIGRGTKIDNLVQVGHNVRIGEDCILCGSAGISGSCELGDRVVLGGQAGVSDHIKIGSGVMIGGKTGVIADIPAGAFYSGFPARPHRENMKMMSALKKLPDILEKLEELAKSVKQDAKETDNK